MKKLFLLSLAVAGIAGSSFAAEFVANGENGYTKTFGEGYSLELVWGAVPDGIEYPAVRTGIGVNDKFYLMDHAAGAVKVYGRKGFIKDIKFDGKIWVSCTVDQAGNVIARNDKGGWAGPEGVGWYLSENAGVGVISSETDEIVKPFIAMPGAPKSRFDALGPVLDNILTSEFTAIYCPTQGAGNRFEEFSFSDGVCNGAIGIPLTIDPTFAGKANTCQTLGSGQAIDEETLALYPNPHLNETGSVHGLGNGIMLWKYESTNEGEGWAFQNKYFVTPQHAPIGGFFVFNVAGVDYIIYPSAGADVAGDAFAISKVKYTDTPVSNTDADNEVLIARKYAAVNENGGLMYVAKAYYYGFNVVPVEGDPNSVLIYSYNAGCPMMVYKFTVPSGSGSAVEDIEIVETSAPVEYFNLQGMRVANPENGVYIKRQGGKVSKVVM